MPYLPSITIADALSDIQDRRLVLPAIQREFVWRPEQVSKLFDSVLRGYPIGSFLSWRVEPETATQFKFYGFMREYSEFDNRHNPLVDTPSHREVTAVLDGQQRLTSLNIGLRGTYAWKKKWTHARFKENFPARTLHLNLAAKAPENAAGLEYDFRWLDERQLANMGPDERKYWMPVPLFLESSKPHDLWKRLGKRDIGNDEFACDTAGTFHSRIHEALSIQFYQETDQDIERVLDIFIRVNSGGTVLSYSDLLLSIATAQWKDRDARKEIHGLVDELNHVGSGFSFSQDLILKTGLVLAGIQDIGFKVKNFTADNMQRLSEEWDGIASSLRVATGLLSDFGLSAATLAANSVLIPVASYIHHLRVGETFRADPKRASDRAVIKSWVMRSLIVPGIWGSALDQLLRAIRDVITDSDSATFPVQELERVMAARGKSLLGSPELIESLLDLKYGDPRTFPLLAMLFDHVNTRNQHHVDHVVPAAQLSRAALRSAGLDSEAVEEMIVMKDRLPNLQLLEGLENISKSSQMPGPWATDTMRDAAVRSSYLDRNLLPRALPSSVEDFKPFYEARRALLRKRLNELLSARGEQGGDDSVVPPLDEAEEGNASL